jgi:hypothetical protein
MNKRKRYENKALASISLAFFVKTLESLCGIRFMLYLTMAESAHQRTKCVLCSFLRFYVHDVQAKGVGREFVQHLVVLEPGDV